MAAAGGKAWRPGTHDEGDCKDCDGNLGNLGPEGGNGGGQVVGAGTPEALITLGTHTGVALAGMLAGQ